VDTGIAPHPDFYHIKGQFNFVNGANGVQTAPHDGFGHGTHVAGMIGSTGYYSYNHKYQGVGTAASVVGLRVLDDDGRGNVSDVIAALDWIVSVGRTTYGVRVANMSLGKGVEESIDTDPLVQAVDAVWNAGVVVVVSAGNFGGSGHYTVASPGNSRRAITVGSLTDNGSGSNYNDDYVSTFSSRGPTLIDHVLKPDLVAPGNKIIAPYAEGAHLASLVGNDKIVCGYSSGSNCSVRYLRLSGTSMAAGLVSGTVARMLQKDPSLTPNTVKARLMKSARKISGSDPTEMGAGVLNVEAALNATGVMGTTAALSPLMQLSSEGDIAYVQDTAQLWNNTQWAAGYLWTDGFLWTNAAPLGASGYLWSNAYLWSNSSTWANSYLWSNGFLWTDAVKPASLEAEDPGEEEPDPEPLP
jgi:serine protease AprX